MWQRLRVEFKEKIWDNEQVLKLRQKFAELDAQTQSYVLIGSFATFVLLLLFTFFTLLGKTITLKKELALMDAQIRMAQNSSVRIEELKAMERNRNTDPMVNGLDTSGPTEAFAERVSQKSLIAKTSTEATAGKAGMADLKLNKISLRQLVRVLYFLEKSSSGTSVEKLNVDAKDDTEGYLWAQLQLKKDAAKGGL